MDFKNRFPNRLTEGSRDPNYGIPPKAPPSNNPFANAFTGRQSTQPSRPVKPLKQTAPAATGLNKYKKAPSKAAAPKGQFKKYMVEANNVFYQQRGELKELERVKLCKWALILIWIVLAVTYFLIGRIAPYEGVCPPRAKCGVFVRCPELFEYHKASNECRLSGDFIAEIEDVARNHVSKLQLEYGMRECYQQEGIPSFNIRDLFEQIDSDKLALYREAAERFFLSKQNQERFGFKVLGYSGIVQPTEKHYSLRCRALMVITDTFQLTAVIGCLLGVAVLIWLVFLVVRSRRSSRIYNYLKQCVMDAQDKTLNISLARSDLETRFGAISDEEWDQVDAVRAGDKKIAYFEDDFLYWKASA